MLGLDLFIYVPIGDEKVNTYSTLMMLTMFSVAALWAYWSFHSEFHKYSIIHIKRKRNEGNFLTRRKDDLILAIISASIGAILTILVTKLVTKFFS